MSTIQEMFSMMYDQARVIESTFGDVLGVPRQDISPLGHGLLEAKEHLEERGLELSPQMGSRESSFITRAECKETENREGSEDGSVSTGLMTPFSLWVVGGIFFFLAVKALILPFTENGRFVST